MRPFSLLRISLAALLLASSPLVAAGPEILVFKTETCGCCGKWVDHLKANGFTPKVRNVPSTAEYRRMYGVPEALASCHTATVGGYTIEGHIPAADIHRLLKEKPKAVGIAVPAMPIGSPGMEVGDRKDPYSVYLFQSDGRTTVFQKHGGK
jgi:hypothetical protein